MRNLLPTLRALYDRWPCWSVSLGLHLGLLILLALFTIPIGRDRVESLILAPSTDETMKLKDQPLLELESRLDEAVPELSELAPGPPDPVLEPQASELPDLLPTQVKSTLTHSMTSKAVDGLLTEIGGASKGGGLQGRDPNARGRLVREAGGNAASEQAVQDSLRWLREHQFPNGGWSLNPIGPDCQCRGGGKLKQAYNGATALALLPFLGAGITHQQGDDCEVVEQGLRFLLMRQQSNGAFIEPGGTLYSHALCTIVLTEAYAMSNDRRLRPRAEAALRYIAFAQDPHGGGWRYEPKQPGDTSVVAWQVMALKSGVMAKLMVEPRVFQGARVFLDSVQSEDGAAYGYQDPGRRTATTAAGLLARMYLGWNHDHAALRRGVERLAKSGPSKVDMYYNYYATQVMRHYGGDDWKKWNKAMRDYLIAQQALVVENAAKHKDNPAFIEDAINTIDNSVARMNTLLKKLQQDEPSELRSLEIDTILMEAIQKCQELKPHPSLHRDANSLYVNADPDRLLMTVVHIIKNAQEATDYTGFIDVTLRTEDNNATIEIEDNGAGMSEDFIKNQLFKPFNTTKSGKGMGIGVYQAKEYIESIGGSVSAESALGSGTTFTLSIPSIKGYQ